MNQTKKVRFPFAAYEYQAAAEYLENMAEKGFWLSSFHLFRAEYAVREPGKRSYYVLIDRKRFVRDEAEAGEYEKRTGWRYVAGNRCCQVYDKEKGAYVRGCGEEERQEHRAEYAVEDLGEHGVEQTGECLSEDERMHPTVNRAAEEREAGKQAGLRLVLLVLAGLYFSYFLAVEVLGEPLRLVTSDGYLAAGILAVWVLLAGMGQICLLCQFGIRKRNSVRLVVWVDRITGIMGVLGVIFLIWVGADHLIEHNPIALLSLVPTGVLLVIYLLFGLIWQKRGMERSKGMAVCAGILVFAAALAMIWPMAQLFDQTLSKQQLKSEVLTLSALGYPKGQAVPTKQSGFLADRYHYEEQSGEVVLSYTIVESSFPAVIQWVKRCFPVDDPKRYRLDAKSWEAEEACLQYGNHLLIFREHQIIRIFIGGMHVDELFLDHIRVLIS